jgi:hypothetical protein
MNGECGRGMYNRKFAYYKFIGYQHLAFQSSEFYVDSLMRNIKKSKYKSMYPKQKPAANLYYNYR